MRTPERMMSEARAIVSEHNSAIDLFAMFLFENGAGRIVLSEVFETDGTSITAGFLPADLFAALVEWASAWTDEERDHYALGSSDEQEYVISCPAPQTVATVHA